MRSVVVSGSVTTTTTWAYDGITLAGYSAQASDGATWSIDYVTDESGRPFAGVYAAGSDTVPFLMVTTDRGDVRELLDSNGEAFAHYAYDVYGNPTSTLPTATGGVDGALAQALASRQVLRYAGYTWDVETSLYYCSQRYYDPRTACFLSKDPARDDGEESAYQYCAGDPVGNVDPTGLWGKKVHYNYTRLMADDHFFGRLAYVSSAIAEGNASADVDSRYAGGSKPETQQYHGYKGAGKAKRRMFRRAVRQWKAAKSKNGRKKAARTFGIALHTLQDVYAHRRHWNERDRSWVAVYDKTDSTFSNPRHTKAHDRWKLADSSCQRKVNTKSHALLAAFRRRIQ